MAPNAGLSPAFQTPGQADVAYSTNSTKFVQLKVGLGHREVVEVLNVIEYIGRVVPLRFYCQVDDVTGE